MQFAIKNRWTGSVIFTAEIAADEDTPLSIKLGLAVRVAVKARADLTRADLTRADLTRADLTGANLMGAYLTDANLTRADLARADLTRANLTRANLTGANLTDADLRGANLRGADLRGANLRDANLRGANLTRANLADAKESVPVIPDIDAAILAAIEAGGSLDMSGWHGCETTHCRAGWAITLAGAAGAELESARGPYLAGCMIYAASRPDKPIPDFYAGDAEAMADIRACAAEQIAAQS